MYQVLYTIACYNPATGCYMTINNFSFLSPRRLTIEFVNPVSRDTISPYLVEGFQWNLSQIFIIRVGIAEKVFSVRSQRSMSQRGQGHSEAKCTFPAEG